LGCGDDKAQQAGLGQTTFGLGLVGTTEPSLGTAVARREGAVVSSLLRSPPRRHPIEKLSRRSVAPPVMLEGDGGGSWGCCLSRYPHLLLLSAAFVVAVSIGRVLYVLYRTGRPFRPGEVRPTVRTLIILGSGGHTAEMLNLLTVLDKDKFAPRYYVAAVTDSMSLQKAQRFEESLEHQETSMGNEMTVAHFMKIYRSREVGQSYLTSIVTTIIAIGHALWLTLKIRPQVVICNGPGTCIPLCASAFLFKVRTLGAKVIGIRSSSVFYVESIARVKKLSLSGWLLYHLNVADQLFVQWPQLQRKYPRAHYVGCLM
ncbi:hypothetical protein Taro_036902, partial [Colocasia esculenta]|nr:hypothetical protein [Colocasia esculenta]